MDATNALPDRIVIWYRTWIFQVLFLGVGAALMWFFGEMAEITGREAGWEPYAFVGAFMAGAAVFGRTVVDFNMNYAERSYRFLGVIPIYRRRRPLDSFAAVTIHWTRIRRIESYFVSLEDINGRLFVIQRLGRLGFDRDQVVQYAGQFAERLRLPLKDLGRKAM